MDHKAFRSPITIFSGNPRRFRVIASAFEAADFLLDSWADHDSECWYKAITHCNAALDGSGSADEARSAFIAAAREAGIQMNADISLP
jgi:hypothetical protein